MEWRKERFSEGQSVAKKKEVKAKIHPKSIELVHELMSKRKIIGIKRDDPVRQILNSVNEKAQFEFQTPLNFL